jgi:hypothetical protein
MNDNQMAAVANLRTGSWVIARWRSYSLILLGGYVIGAIAWIGLADGLIDHNGKPLGTDFSNIYAAGTLTLNGEPEASFDPVRQHAAEVAVFGRQVPFYGWHYPPLFLLVAAPLALLPYAVALIVWLASTFALYLAVVRSILPRPETVLLAAAFPAVFINVGHGHNGFLTAALIGGALLTIDRKPALAGVLIGLLAYKPQFGVLIPLILVGTSRWAVFAYAAVTLLAVTALSIALLGLEPWNAFVQFSHFTRTVVLEAGDTGWEKIQTLFSAVRMFGGSVTTAYAAQTGLALLVAASVVRLWRSDAASELKASGLICASLLTTPYMLDYDLIVLSIAIAFFARFGLAEGFRSFEVTLLAILWAMPLVARGAAAFTMIPLALISILAFYCIILMRAVASSQKSNSGRARIVEI